MLKLVLDTNTFISAFFWEGNESELFDQIETGKAKLFITKEILTEVENVIRRPKFKEVLFLTNQEPEEIIEKIVSVSNLVIGPDLNINICRDPEDNNFLECAELAKADYIVSGDKDLLSLKKYKNIGIIKSLEALKLIKSPK